MPLIPSPYRIIHIPRYISDNTDPDTGNAVIEDGDPVVRRIQSVGQAGGQQESGDSLLRVVDDITISVSNPEVYSAGDQIILDPTFDDDGEWIVGTGEAYRVNGSPNDSRLGPWPRLLRVFGGTINAKRVT